MKYKIAAVIVLSTLYGLPAKALPLSAAGSLSNRSINGDAVQKVEYWEHSRWRSHHRWGSGGGEGWHNRWRSHWRWGSGWGHRDHDWDRDRWYRRDRY